MNGPEDRSISVSQLSGLLKPCWVLYLDLGSLSSVCCGLGKGRGGAHGCHLWSSQKEQYLWCLPSILPLPYTVGITGLGSGEDFAIYLFLVH